MTPEEEIRLQAIKLAIAISEHNPDNMFAGEVLEDAENIAKFILGAPAAPTGLAALEEATVEGPNGPTWNTTGPVERSLDTALTYSET